MKKLFIPLGILIVATIILVIIALNLTSTAELELLIAPSSATVLIDDKEYQNGTFRIPSGEHTISITKDGFTPKKYSFNTSSTSKIYDYIIETDGTYDWYLSHPDDSLLLTQIGDYHSDQLASSALEKHPIIEHLPIIYANFDQEYNYTEYRIDGGSFDDCNTDFCLKITDSTGGNYNSAVQNIKDLGFNPEDFTILYEYTPAENL